jgi:hypothetical protein
VPNTDCDDFAQDVAEQTIPGYVETESIHRIGIFGSRKICEARVGSKTCSGLTYLELVLIDIVGL